MPCQILPFPQDLETRLPNVLGNVDYLALRRQLEHIDALLADTGLERFFVQLALDAWLARSKTQPGAAEQARFQQRSCRALRCNILRTLVQDDFRGFSCQLASSPLYQWFCHLDAVNRIRVPSKSELQRFAQWLPAAQMRQVNEELIRILANADAKTLQLQKPVDLDAVFLDTTCIKANIHFPIDWVLLRDGVRTLMKATRLIREQGLCQRMESPEVFLRRMNSLCMEMSRRGRGTASKKERKRVLRLMKKLTVVVQDHARRHRDLLDAKWEKTKWTRPQAQQVLRRIDEVLELLPKAVKQAHERIIGERPVANANKMLSLYDQDVRVIVRGKAGAEVEFGNTLLVAENSQGLIVDAELFRTSAPADSQLLFRSLARLWSVAGRKPEAVVTDRAFSSQSNSDKLKEGGTLDATCPKKPAELKERMKDGKFAALQKRRAQTEGRIGVLKNGFLGAPMRAEGFEHRERAVMWGVLTHNLWVLARLRVAKEEKKPKKRGGGSPLRKAA